MQLLTPKHYYQALEKSIPKATDHIVIHAMVVIFGGKTETLVPLLHDALARGVEVRIIGDIYSKYEAKTARLGRRGPYLNWEHNTAICEKLVAKGASITYIGTLRLNPFKGRCHSKITIIDTAVYTFGGVNFSNAHFDYQDYMLEIKDSEFADRAYALTRDIERNTRLTNIIETIDDYATLLFDGGEPKNSVIYNTACEIIANAKKVYYVSKMCPSGKIASLLSATDSECYFNTPRHEGFPDNLAIIFDQFRFNIKNQYTRLEHIHAKFILTEGKDGSRHCLTGSNNFSWRGVAFGTKEIAVHSTDPKLWDQLYAFLKQQIR